MLSIRSADNLVSKKKMFEIINKYIGKNLFNMTVDDLRNLLYHKRSCYI